MLSPSATRRVALRRGKRVGAHSRRAAQTRREARLSSDPAFDLSAMNYSRCLDPVGRPTDGFQFRPIAVVPCDFFPALPQPRALAGSPFLRAVQIKIAGIGCQLRRCRFVGDHTAPGARLVRHVRQSSTSVSLLHSCRGPDRPPGSTR